MALLYMDSFDARDLTLKYLSYGLGTGSLGGGESTTWGGGRFSTGSSLGGRSYASGIPYLSTSFTAASQVTIGMAVYISTSSATCNILRLWGDGGATNQITIRLINGSLQALRGDQNGTVIASAAAGLYASAEWHHLEVQASVNSSTGTVEVRLDGVQRINFTGNTKAGGTNNTIDASTLWFDGGGVFYYVDDYYILNNSGSAPYNTFLGDVRIYTMSPSAAGASTQFTPSSGANYTTVDELPYSTSDYVSSSTVGNRDTYTLADLPANATTIFGLQTNLIAKKTDAGTMAVKPVLRSGGTNYYGTTVGLISSDKTTSDIRSLDPATSAGWTSSGINNLEIGVEIA